MQFSMYYIFVILRPSSAILLFQHFNDQFVFRHCKDKAIFWENSYEKSHVPLFVQPFMAFVQLSVQSLGFSAYSRHLSAV